MPSKMSIELINLAVLLTLLIMGVCYFKFCGKKTEKKALTPHEQYKILRRENYLYWAKIKQRSNVCSDECKGCAFCK